MDASKSTPDLPATIILQPVSCGPPNIIGRVARL
jgi:hypothetical protein